MQPDLLYLQSRKFHHATAEFNNLFDKGSFRGRSFGLEDIKRWQTHHFLP